MPLMWLSLAFLAGVALGSLFSLAAWAWLLLAGGMLVAALLGWRTASSAQPVLARLGACLSLRSPFANLSYVLLLGVCLLGAARYAAAQPGSGPENIGAHANDHSTYVLEGVINKPPVYLDTQTELTLSAERIRLLYTTDWTPVHGQALVTLDPGGTWRYGDRLQARGLIEYPSSAESSSYRSYLAGQGISASLSHPQVARLQAGQGNPLLRAIYSVRESAQAVARRIYPDPEASLVEGILLGDDSGLSQEVAGAFRATGTTHIIAISGVNIHVTFHDFLYILV
jgi:competence protein ComEC